MRIMALDVGDRKIGIAVSDPMCIIANPLETYFRQHDKADFAYLKDLCASKEVTKIICGLPKKLDNSDSIQTQKVRTFAAELESVLEIPVVLFDERLTTVSAERMLIEGNVRRDDRKQVIDKVAATIILQNYLDIKSYK